MKLRVNQLSIAPPYVDLPGDLTGYAVTLDLSHSDAAHEATLGALISEIRSRGASRVVITGSPPRTPGHPQQRRLKEPGRLNAERAPNSRRGVEARYRSRNQCAKWRAPVR